MLIPLDVCPAPPAGPLAKIYFGSQFAPLIIFFVMFLSVVKNTKLHHFVRFNCMQVGGLMQVNLAFSAVLFWGVLALRTTLCASTA